MEWSEYFSWLVHIPWGWGDSGSSLLHSLSATVFFAYFIDIPSCKLHRPGNHPHFHRMNIYHLLILNSVWSLPLCCKKLSRYFFSKKEKKGKNQWILCLTRDFFLKKSFWRLIARYGTPTTWPRPYLQASGYPRYLTHHHWPLDPPGNWRGSNEAGHRRCRSEAFLRIGRCLGDEVHWTHQTEPDDIHSS